MLCDTFFLCRPWTTTHLVQRTFSLLSRLPPPAEEHKLPATQYWQPASRIFWQDNRSPPMCAQASFAVVIPHPSSLISVVIRHPSSELRRAKENKSNRLNKEMNLDKISFTLDHIDIVPSPGKETWRVSTASLLLLNISYFHMLSKTVCKSPTRTPLCEGPVFPTAIRCAMVPLWAPNNLHSHTYKH